MNHPLLELLNKYRSAARSEREKGTYFEQLCVAYLRNDPLQAAQYDEVWTYADWAEQNEREKRDVGIDLVARIRDGGGFCAIQCKFYGESKIIQKRDIDSFFTASGKAPFVRRLIIDTTSADWGDNAEDAMRDQQIETKRIGLSDMLASPIDWSHYAKDQTVSVSKKSLRPHQQEALNAVQEGFLEADRGKLLMACGTGKTFTALKIAEHLAGRGKAVLYLVPSLALMSQTVTEWTGDTETPLKSFAVCSDVQVGKRKASDDIADLEIHDLAFPATTDARKLAEKLPLLPDADTSLSDDSEMLVVFSTYQSIQAISDAQLKYGLREFDLIICDEAHRTTGAIFDDEQSNFVKVHDQGIVKGKKRLYMTATPRIFGESVKAKASEASVELCSMDDEALFGNVLFQRGFGWAVENELLTDYKVIVLAVDEGMVSAAMQKHFKDSDSALVLDDATKIIGCYKALTKADLKQDASYDARPMQRALAFCKDIKTSKLIASEFPLVAAEYHDAIEAEKEDNDALPRLDCDVDHVDGTFNATSRNRLLDWLREDMADDECRILSNARCLSEGVDVPALDAILFMHPRKSQVDVVQAVGRVMRRAEGKKMGYVILPVGIPAGMKPEEALNDNEKYKVIWQILNALRAHDERFDSTINKIEFGVDASHQIEVIPVTNQMPTKAVPEATGADIGGGSANDEDERSEKTKKTPVQTSFVFDEFAAAIMAKIVKKCGTREYWDTWAKDIAKIAQTHITRIKTIVEQEGEERKYFIAFLDEIRDDLNPEISETDAVEMLAQHLITKPVFDTLFEDNEFTKNNPVSRAMELVLAQLDQHNLGKEAESLERFYASVKRRASGINNAQGRQALVVELYDKFFRTAFPAMTQKLGIVYTPVEVVDFIIHSVNDVLQSEFGQTLGSKGVHILDPFTGTGTFITRLLQSGLIKPDELEHKYKHEIHANEIVLLAYYIAAINIEAVYHDMAKENAIEGDESDEGMRYSPFDGIVLTDTFQLYEQDKDMIADLLPDNSERRTAQKERDIRVIVGNPPYSAKQTASNDNAQNISYPNLDMSISDSYAKASSAINKQDLYDSYIRAYRWASDRLAHNDSAGVVAYVSNAGWLEGTATDGFRKCLAEEFSKLYIFHLRGNTRTSGETARKEGGQTFGSGSRAPIAITILVRNPKAVDKGNIYFHDIGDYLDRKAKLSIVRTFKSISGISEADGWRKLVPDESFDWVNQGSKDFFKHFPIGDRKGVALFQKYGPGLVSNRDAWVFNSSTSQLEINATRMITNYNDLLSRKVTPSEAYKVPASLVNWSRSLKKHYESGRPIDPLEGQITVAHYRPYSKQHLFASKSLNEVSGICSSFLRTEDDRVFSIVGRGENTPFSVLMSNCIPELKLLYNGQNFPLKIYEHASVDDGLFATGETGYIERDGISDAGLKHFQNAYAGEKMSKEDLFYYVYGLLHSPDYRERFKNNLSKELPRIPAVKTAADFWAFSKAGRALGDLHVNYESVEPYPVTIAEGDLRLVTMNTPETFYRVEKMKFCSKGRDKDKTTVIYNHNITMQDIPLEAYDYVVNGKPALEWVMERQCVKTDKASGIVNDANDYANETVGNPAYPLELFQRVITVSLETMKLVRSLPALDID